MAEVEGATGTTQEQLLQAAKKRIADGKGTPDDFQMVGKSLVSDAKKAVDPKNLPGVGNMNPPAPKPQNTNAFDFNPIDAYYNYSQPIVGQEAANKRKAELDTLLSKTKGDLATWAAQNPEKFLELKSNFNAQAAQEMQKNRPGSALDSANQAFYRKNEMLNDVANTLRLGQPAPAKTIPVATPATPSTTAPKTFTMEGVIPAVKAPATGTTGGEVEAKPETPKMKQISETVERMKAMDPLTIWDILEGTLKGAMGDFNTTRKQKVADYKQAQKDFEDRIAERQKTEQSQAFQKELAGEQFEQEKELTQMNLDAQKAAAVDSRAAALQKQGYDRETAIILARMQIDAETAKTKPTTPQQIAAAALGGAR